ncbi:MAG: pilus assembly protein PilS [Hyphomicrobiales bacterium]|nr:MAG: pilus assembly protein PilS [Hyphomicrobiales bacterium]
MSFPRRRESSMLDAGVLAVMTPLDRRMLDSRLRGNDTELF